MSASHQFCFMKDPDLVFKLVKINERQSNGTLVVSDFDSSSTKQTRVPEQDTIPVHSIDELENPPTDLIKLQHVHQATILHTLRSRFSKDQIYTSIGPILVALNPFKWIPGIYDDPVKNRYKSREWNLSDNPHVFAIAHDSFSDLQYGENQSMIISGESGAGKTEATKQALNYLAYIAGSSSGIQEKILKASPILEAWGNAKTLRNNNSSRFGKYIEVWFDGNTIIGSSNTTYILEKSRVVKQASEERNYHVFYQLLAGADVQQLSSYRLVDPSTQQPMPPDAFFYINQSGCVRIDDVDDAADHREAIAAFQEVGFSAQEVDDLFRVIAGVLQLGNVLFQTEGDNSAITAATEGWFHACAEVFHVDKELFRSALLFKKVRSGGGKRSSVALSPYSPEAAVETRDAFAKEIYRRCFDWIVSKINLLMYDDRVRPTNMIGVLDIFGFEIFKQNSFEQLCINLANEALQQHFNYHIFQAEINIYESEDVPVPPLDYKDNQDVLDMIMKRPKGLLPVLDEECMVPKGSWEGFVNKFSKQQTGNARFKYRNKAGIELGVVHYAGEVYYDPSLFLVKNKDTLAQDLVEVFSASGNRFITSLFDEVMILQREASVGSFRKGMKGDDDGDDVASPTAAPTGGRMMKRSSTVMEAKQTVGKKFSLQLESLMKNLNATKPRYIRCVKPNQLKKPNIFVNHLTNEQLTYSGVFEAVIIMQNGYPFRLDHAEFRDTYHVLVQNSIYKSLLQDAALYQAFEAASNRQLLWADERSFQPFAAPFIAQRKAKGKQHTRGPIVRKQCELMVNLIARSLTETPLNRRELFVGHTKIFYRAPEHRVLLQARELLVNKALRTLQACARRYIAYKLVKTFRKDVQTLLQAMQRRDLSTLAATSSLLAALNVRLDKVSPGVQCSVEIVRISQGYSQAMLQEQQCVAAFEATFSRHVLPPADASDERATIAAEAALLQALLPTLETTENIHFVANYRGLEVHVVWTENAALVDFVQRVYTLQRKVHVAQLFTQSLQDENEVLLARAREELELLREQQEVPANYLRAFDTQAQTIIQQAEELSHDILTQLQTQLAQGVCHLVDASSTGRQGGVAVTAGAFSAVKDCVVDPQPLQHLLQEAQAKLAALRKPPVRVKIALHALETMVDLRTLAQTRQWEALWSKLGAASSSATPTTTASSIDPPPMGSPKWSDHKPLTRKHSNSTASNSSDHGQRKVIPVDDANPLRHSALPRPILELLDAETHNMIIASVTFFLLPRFQEILAAPSPIPEAACLEPFPIDTTELEAQLAFAKQYQSFFDQSLTDFVLRMEEHLFLRQAVASGSRDDILRQLQAKSIAHIPPEHPDVVHAKRYPAMYDVLQQVAQLFEAEKWRGAAGQFEPSQVKYEALAAWNQRCERTAADGDGWHALLYVCQVICDWKKELSTTPRLQCAAMLDALVEIIDPASEWSQSVDQLLTFAQFPELHLGVRILLAELQTLRGELGHYVGMSNVLLAFDRDQINENIAMPLQSRTFSLLQAAIDENTPRLLPSLAVKDAILERLVTIQTLREMAVNGQYDALGAKLDALPAGFDECSGFPAAVVAQYAYTGQVLAVRARWFDYFVRKTVAERLYDREVPAIGSNACALFDIIRRTMEPTAQGTELSLTPKAKEDVLLAKAFFALRCALRDGRWEPVPLVFFGRVPTERLVDVIVKGEGDFPADAKSLDRVLSAVRALDHASSTERVEQRIRAVELGDLCVSDLLAWFEQRPELADAALEEIRDVQRQGIDRRVRAIILLAVTTGRFTGNLDKVNHRTVRLDELRTAVTYCRLNVDAMSSVARGWLAACEMLLKLREIIVKVYSDVKAATDPTWKDTLHESIHVEDIQALIAAMTADGFPVDELQLILDKIIDLKTFEELEQALTFGAPTFVNGKFDLSRLQYDHLVERLDTAKKVNMQRRSDRLDRFFFYLELVINLRTALSANQWDLSERGSDQANKRSALDRYVITVKRCLAEYEQAQRFFRTPLPGVPPPLVIDEFALVAREWERRLTIQRFHHALKTGAITGTPFHLVIHDARTDLLEAEIQRAASMEAASGEVDRDVQMYVQAAKELVALRKTALETQKQYRSHCQFGKQTNSIRAILGEQAFLPDCISKAVHRIDEIRKSKVELRRYPTAPLDALIQDFRFCTKLPLDLPEVTLLQMDYSERCFTNEVLTYVAAIDSGVDVDANMRQALTNLQHTFSTYYQRTERLTAAALSGGAATRKSGITGAVVRGMGAKALSLTAAGLSGGGSSGGSDGSKLWASQFLHDSALFLVHYLRAKTQDLYDHPDRDWKRDVNLENTPRVTALQKNLKSGRYTMQQVIRAAYKCEIHHKVAHVLRTAEAEIEDRISHQELETALSQEGLAASGSIGRVVIPDIALSYPESVLTRIETVVGSRTGHIKQLKVLLECIYTMRLRLHEHKFLDVLTAAAKFIRVGQKDLAFMASILYESSDGLSVGIARKEFFLLAKEACDRLWQTQLLDIVLKGGVRGSRGAVAAFAIQFEEIQPMLQVAETMTEKSAVTQHWARLAETVYLLRFKFLDLFSSASPAALATQQAVAAGLVPTTGGGSGGSGSGAAGHDDTVVFLPHAHLDGGVAKLLEDGVNAGVTNVLELGSVNWNVSIARDKAEELLDYLLDVRDQLRATAAQLLPSTAARSPIAAGGASALSPMAPPPPPPPPGALTSPSSAGASSTSPMSSPLALSASTSASTSSASLSTQLLTSVENEVALIEDHVRFLLGVQQLVRALEVPFFTLEKDGLLLQASFADLADAARQMAQLHLQAQRPSEQWVAHLLRWSERLVAVMEQVEAVLQRRTNLVLEPGSTEFAAFCPFLTSFLQFHTSLFPSASLSMLPAAAGQQSAPYPRTGVQKFVFPTEAMRRSLVAMSDAVRDHSTVLMLHSIVFADRLLWYEQAETHQWVVTVKRMHAIPFVIQHGVDAGLIDVAAYADEVDFLATSIRDEFDAPKTSTSQELVTYTLSLLQFRCAVMRRQWLQAQTIVRHLAETTSVHTNTKDFETFQHFLTILRAKRQMEYELLLSMALPEFAYWSLLQESGVAVSSMGRGLERFMRGLVDGSVERLPTLKIFEALTEVSYQVVEVTKALRTGLWISAADLADHPKHRLFLDAVVREGEQVTAPWYDAHGGEYTHSVFAALMDLQQRLQHCQSIGHYLRAFLQRKMQQLHREFVVVQLEHVVTTALARVTVLGQPGELVFADQLTALHQVVALLDKPAHRDVVEHCHRLRQGYLTVKALYGVFASHRRGDVEQLIDYVNILIYCHQNGRPPGLLERKANVRVKALTQSFTSASDEEFESVFSEPLHLFVERPAATLDADGRRRSTAAKQSGPHVLFDRIVDGDDADADGDSGNEASGDPVAAAVADGVATVADEEDARIEEADDMNREITASIAALIGIRWQRRSQIPAVRSEVASLVPLLEQHCLFESLYSDYEKAMRDAPAAGHPGEDEALAGVRYESLERLLPLFSVFPQLQQPQQPTSYVTLLYTAAVTLHLVRQSQVFGDTGGVRDALQLWRDGLANESDYEAACAASLAQTTHGQSVSLFGGRAKTFCRLAQAEMAFAEEDVQQRFLIATLREALAHPPGVVDDWTADQSHVEIESLVEACKVAQRLGAKCPTAAGLYDAARHLYKLRRHVAEKQWPAVLDAVLGGGGGGGAAGDEAKPPLYDAATNTWRVAANAHEFETAWKVAATAQVTALVEAAYRTGRISSKIFGIKSGAPPTTAAADATTAAPPAADASAAADAAAATEAADGDEEAVSSEACAHVVDVAQRVFLLRRHDHAAASTAASALAAGSSRQLWVSGEMQRHLRSCRLLLELRTLFLTGQHDQLLDRIVSLIRGRPRPRKASVFARVEDDDADGDGDGDGVRDGDRDGVVSDGEARDDDDDDDDGDRRSQRDAAAEATAVTAEPADSDGEAPSAPTDAAPAADAAVAAADEAVASTPTATDDDRATSAAPAVPAAAAPTTTPAAAAATAAEDEFWAVYDLSDLSPQCQAEIASIKSRAAYAVVMNLFRAALGTQSLRGEVGHVDASALSVTRIVDTSVRAWQIGFQHEDVLLMQRSAGFVYRLRQAQRRNRWLRDAVTDVGSAAHREAPYRSLLVERLVDTSAASAGEPDLVAADDLRLFRAHCLGGPAEDAATEAAEAEEAAEFVEDLFGDDDWAELQRRLSLHAATAPELRFAFQELRYRQIVVSLLQGVYSAGYTGTPGDVQDEDADGASLVETAALERAIALAMRHPELTRRDECYSLLRDAKLLLAVRQCRLHDDFAELNDAILRAEEHNLKVLELRVRDDAASGAADTAAAAAAADDLRDGSAETGAAAATGAAATAAPLPRKGAAASLQPILPKVWEEIKLLKYDALFQLALAEFSAEMTRDEDADASDRDVDEDAYADEDAVLLRHGERIANLRNILDFAVEAAQGFACADFDRLVEAVQMAIQLREFVRDHRGQRSPQGIIDQVAKVKLRDRKRGVTCYMTLLIYELSKLSNVLEFPVLLEQLHQEILAGKAYLRRPIGMIDYGAIKVDAMAEAYQLAKPSMEIMGTDENLAFMNLARALLDLRLCLRSGDLSAAMNVVVSNEAHLQVRHFTGQATLPSTVATVASTTAVTTTAATSFKDDLAALAALAEDEVSRLRIEMENYDAGRLISHGLKTGRCLHVVAIAKMRSYFCENLAAVLAEDDSEYVAYQRQQRSLAAAAATAAATAAADSAAAAAAAAALHATASPGGGGGGGGGGRKLSVTGAAGRKTRRVSAGIQQMLSMFQERYLQQAAGSVDGDDADAVAVAVAVPGGAKKTSYSLAAQLLEEHLDQQRSGGGGGGASDAALFAAGGGDEVDDPSIVDPEVVDSIRASIYGLRRAVAVARRVSQMSEATRYYFRAAETILSLREGILHRRWAEVIATVQQDLDLPPIALEEVNAVREGLFLQRCVEMVAEALLRGAADGQPFLVQLELVESAHLEEIVEALEAGAFQDAAALNVIELARLVIAVRRAFVAWAQAMRHRSASWQPPLSSPDGAAATASVTATATATTQELSMLDVHDRQLEAALVRVDDFLRSNVRDLLRALGVLAPNEADVVPSPFYWVNHLVDAVYAVRAEIVTMKEAVDYARALHHLRAVVGVAPLPVAFYLHHRDEEKRFLQRREARRQRRRERRAAAKAATASAAAATAVDGDIDAAQRWQLRGLGDASADDERLSSTFPYRSSPHRKAPPQTPQAQRIAPIAEARDDEDADAVAFNGPDADADADADDDVDADDDDEDDEPLPLSLSLPTIYAASRTQDFVWLPRLYPRAMADWALYDRVVRGDRYFVTLLREAIAATESYVAACADRTSDELLADLRFAKELLALRELLAAAQQPPQDTAAGSDAAGSDAAGATTTVPSALRSADVFALMERLRSLQHLRPLSPGLAANVEVALYAELWETADALERRLLATFAEHSLTRYPLDTLAAAWTQDDELDAQLLPLLEDVKADSECVAGLVLRLPRLVAAMEDALKIRKYLLLQNRGHVDVLLRRHAATFAPPGRAGGPAVPAAFAVPALLRREYRYMAQLRQFHAFDARLRHTIDRFPRRVHVDRSGGDRLVLQQTYAELAALFTAFDALERAHARGAVDADEDADNDGDGDGDGSDADDALSETERQLQAYALLSPAYFAADAYFVAADALFALLAAVLNERWLASLQTRTQRAMLGKRVLCRDALFLEFFHVAEGSVISRESESASVQRVSAQGLSTSVAGPATGGGSGGGGADGGEGDGDDDDAFNALTVFGVLQTTNWAAFPAAVAAFFDTCRSRLLELHILEDLRYYAVKGAAQLDAQGNCVLSTLYLRMLATALREVARVNKIAAYRGAAMTWSTEMQQWLDRATMVHRLRAHLIGSSSDGGGDGGDASSWAALLEAYELLPRHEVRLPRDLVYDRHDDVLFREAVVFRAHLAALQAEDVVVAAVAWLRRAHATWTVATLPRLLRLAPELQALRQVAHELRRRVDAHVSAHHRRMATVASLLLTTLEAAVRGAFEAITRSCDALRQLCPLSASLATSTSSSAASAAGGVRSGGERAWSRELRALLSTGFAASCLILAKRQWPSFGDESLMEITCRRLVGVGGGGGDAGAASSASQSQRFHSDAVRDPAAYLRQQQQQTAQQWLSHQQQQTPGATATAADDDGRGGGEAQATARWLDALHQAPTTAAAAAEASSPPAARPFQQCTDDVITRLCELLFFLPEYKLEEVIVYDDGGGGGGIGGGGGSFVYAQSAYLTKTVMFAGNDATELLPFEALQRLVVCFCAEMSPAYKVARPHWTMVMLLTLYYLREELRYRLVTLQLAWLHVHGGDPGDDDDATTVSSAGHRLRQHLSGGGSGVGGGGRPAAAPPTPPSLAEVLRDDVDTTHVSLHIPHALLAFYRDMVLGKYIARSTLHRDAASAAGASTTATAAMGLPRGGVVNAVTVDSVVAGFFPADSPSVATLGKYLCLVRQQQLQEEHQERIRVMMLYWQQQQQQRPRNDPQEAAFQAMLAAYAKHHRPDFDLQSLHSASAAAAAATAATSAAATGSGHTEEKSATSAERVSEGLATLLSFLRLDTPSVVWLMEEVSALADAAKVAHDEGFTSAASAAAARVEEPLALGVALRSYTLYTSFWAMLTSDADGDVDNAAGRRTPPPPSPATLPASLAIHARFANYWQTNRGIDSALISPVPMPDGFDYKQYLSSYRDAARDDEDDDDVDFAVMRGPAPSQPTASTAAGQPQSFSSVWEEVEHTQRQLLPDPALAALPEHATGLVQQYPTDMVYAAAAGASDGRPPPRTPLRPKLNFRRTDSLNAAMFGDEAAGTAILW